MRKKWKIKTKNLPISVSRSLWPGIKDFQCQFFPAHLLHRGHIDKN